MAKPAAAIIGSDIGALPQFCGGRKALASATIDVTAINDATTIAGTATNSITDKQTAMPFSNVTVADVDNLAAAPPNPQALTVRIVMDNLDKGSLQNLGGFTVVSNGVLQMVGFAPAVTTSLRNMVFVPVESVIGLPFFGS